MNTCARQQRLRNPLHNCLLSKTNKTFLFIWISTVSSLQALLLLCVSEKIFFRVNNNPKWMRFIFVQQLMINNIYIVHVCHNICIHTYIHYYYFFLLHRCILEVHLYIIYGLGWEGDTLLQFTHKIIISLRALKRTYKIFNFIS